MRPEDRISLLVTEAVLSISADEPAGEVLRLFAGYPGPTARALLHFHQRATELGQALDAADRYVSAGQSQQLHTALVRIIAQHVSAPLAL